MPRTVHREAAEWFARRSERVQSEAEEAAFKAWYRADPQNAEAYNALMIQVERLRRLRGKIDASELLRPPRRRLSAAAFIGVALLAACTACFVLVEHVSVVRWETGAEEQRVIALPDGSTLELNADGSVEVRFSARRRLVRLRRGEALFDVAHSPSAPFEVEARGGRVRAEGTVFAVSAAQPAALSVIVTEGVVVVEPRGAPDLTQPLRIDAGRRLEWRDGASNVTSVGPADVAQALGWRQRMLAFERQPLRVVVREVERQTLSRFLFAQADLEELEFTAYVRAVDVDEFVRGLETTYPMLSVSPTEGGYLIQRRAEASL